MRKKTVCLVIGVSSLLFTSHIVAENMPEWGKTKWMGSLRKYL